ncbi:MAG TPA: hemerythrin domain-containing protein [Cyclobacteriaceae bacterium]|nr:hemerythrin domain-containing protein [Cyclobacteriaceae bacterium]
MHIEELDIRSLSPFDQKKTIIENLDQMKQDQHLMIIFNYNPAAFLNMLEKERKGLYSAVQIIDGPPVWHLEFTAHSPDLSISELIGLNPSSIEIFEQYGIPYFQKGDRKISDFLRNRHISLRDFIKEALAHKNHFFNLTKPWDWDTEFLISFIRENHHKNLLDKISNLNERIVSLEQIHGAAYPMLKVLKEEFRDFMFLQKDHLAEEEQYLFPLILSAVNKNKTPDKNDSEKIMEAINWMAEDHQAIAGNLHSIQKITNHFVSPDDSIIELTWLFGDLRAFENDYHYHMLLENFYLPGKLRGLNSA